VSARWRGIRRELQALGLMLWDSTRPLTDTQRVALEQSWELYLLDREAFAVATNNDEAVAA
jgi:hypothetical protein